MRIIIEHLQNVKSTLEAYAAQAGLGAHGDVVGRAREGIADHFLMKNLPESISFLTGQIFDPNDSRSGQIDLIVYPSRSPRLNLYGVQNLVFVDFVIAAIEVKSKLTTASWDKVSHLKSALDGCHKVKKLRRLHPIGAALLGDQVTLAPTPYMIFAYDGPTHPILEQKLIEYQEMNGIDLSCMPDIITVLSRNYYLVQNNGFHFERVKRPNIRWSHNLDHQITMLGIYVYLIKLIELYELTPRHTPFSDYLKELSGR